jgi:radical SAM protein with 4Fe4S-binding SPASM domain
MNAAVDFRSTPRAASLDAARARVLVGKVVTGKGGAVRVVAACQLARPATIALDLCRADGSVAAEARRAGSGHVRIAVDLPAQPPGTEHLAWLRVAGAEPVQLRDIRFSVDDLDDPQALDHWTLTGADRIGADIVLPPGGQVTLASPPLKAEEGTRYLIDGEALVQGGAEARVWLQDSAGKHFGERVLDATGDWLFACPCQSGTSGSVQIVVSLANRSAADLCILRAPRIGFRELPRWTSGFEEVETELPHWSRWQRAIHRRCKTSMTFNGVVQALEVRLGREELLSLPQYMAICPTGQCNALCDFCSVTINRTGIVKRQLKHDVLSRFLAPVRKTVRVFGLEGNGEPTLYREFLPLVTEVTSGGTDAYLITNASRLDRDTLKHLSLLESVNVSLNAATAETHRRVMKLKDFEAATSAIRQLVRMRGKRPDGWNAAPRVSVSFVVTHDNVHEVQDFLAFAEYDLGVDVVYIRPLSQLGNDLGVVEDMRRIVPFDSDIDDMLEAVADYGSDRRKTLDIRFDATTFRSTRPDPVGGVVMPLGYEDRLLAPRRTGWTYVTAARTAWTLSKLRLSLPRGSGDGKAMVSQPIPVAPRSSLRFEADVHVISGAMKLVVADADTGAVLASASAEETGGPQPLALTIETGDTRAVVIRLDAPSGVMADIDFGRVRRPAPFVGDAFVFPGPSRWERGMPDVGFAWEARSVTLESAAAPGRYLLRSFAVPSAQGRVIRLPLRGNFTRGSAGVGVLSADGTQFLATADLSVGTDEQTLVFRTGANDTVSIALYGLVPGGTAGVLTFGEAETEPDPDWTAEPVAATASPQKTVVVLAEADTEEAEPAAGEAAPAEAAVARAPIRRTIMPKPVQKRTFKRRLRDLVMGRDRIYCHKPWTDMHNFTVDGRVDVCCIATGPSQEYYQLGNLMNQPFHAIWNGDRAKEFRRTVNSDQPLPPCERCPMSHAYQGPLLDPVHTMGQFRAQFFSREFLNRRYTRYIGYAGYYLGWVVLQFVVFRGFKRHPLGGLGRLGAAIGRRFGI